MSATSPMEASYLHAEPLAGKIGVGDRRIRILLVYEHRSAIALSIAEAMAECGDFDVKHYPITAGTSNLSSARLSLVESMYRFADRMLFGRKLVSPAQTCDAQPFELMNDAAREGGYDCLVDLTGGAVAGRNATHVPIIALLVEGLPVDRLEDAIRLRLGTPGGMAFISAFGNVLSESKWLWEARCYLEHRSLTRSVHLVAAKMPAVILGAWRRLHLKGREAPIPFVARPTPLSAWQLLGRLLATSWRWLLHREQWSIRLYGNFENGHLSCHVADIQPGPNEFFADPFVASDGHDRTTVLFEVLPFATNRGYIAAADVLPDGSLSPPRPVLEQPYHLSYPFVFHWQGRQWMIPESSANRSVDLYQCTSFPDGWRHSATLLTGVRAADATLIEFNGDFWLFAAQGAKGASMFDELHLYWADTPFGPWRPHPLNPVLIDAGCARPAGAFFWWENRLVRPAQDCSDTYGGGVVLLEIVVLDRFQYMERLVGSLAADGVSHDCPVHSVNGNGHIFAIDVLRAIRR